MKDTRTVFPIGEIMIGGVFLKDAVVMEREKYETLAAEIFNKGMDDAMRPVPGSETEKREDRGEYIHTTHSTEPCDLMVQIAEQIVRNRNEKRPLEIKIGELNRELRILQDRRREMEEGK